MIDVADLVLIIIRSGYLVPLIRMIFLRPWSSVKLFHRSSKYDWVVFLEWIQLYFQNIFQLYLKIQLLYGVLCFGKFFLQALTYVGQKAPCPFFTRHFICIEGIFICLSSTLLVYQTFYLYLYWQSRFDCINILLNCTLIIIFLFFIPTLAF